MEIREAPVLPQQAELSAWLQDLRSKVLGDYSTLATLIAVNTAAIVHLATKWCTNGSGGTLTAGMPVYFSAVNTVHLADGSDSAKRARGFCVDIETKALIAFVGPVDDVPIETGITIAFGDTLWLSVAGAGKCTNVRPTSGIRQRLGFATEDENSTNKTVDMVASLSIPGIR